VELGVRCVRDACLVLFSPRDLTLSTIPRPIGCCVRLPLPIDRSLARTVQCHWRWQEARG